METINTAISEIQESLTSETKSSAGDKHETSRAMLQIEREKIGNQFAETQKLKHTLSKIKITKASNAVTLGSIVYTTQNNYFVSISIGELKINDLTFYAVSLNTPIGKLLLSKRIGDEIVFRNEKFEVTDII
ncbi:3-oxoacyl-ACP synthase [Yeosuana sp. MJ-SS3]|uniref:3-oxoacyl-ACP synthase n=1 Tax=Gilvirhabdus luticola TaxID=3079858 RepID=A0ABU3U328_9FLAO|nr:3-oxoacyl-ACP synthase [Yeosuana sp. MJ-SS3]MDU8884736.1 3-oxoacyl-ACP synthase [Yeosuana sp. MJ-SS3]